VPRSRDSIVLVAGIVPNPVVVGLPVEKDKRGHIVVDGTMRCPSRPEVWALGDCASIPAPDGKPYLRVALGGRVAGDVERQPEVLVDVAACLLEVDVCQARVVRPAGRDHYMVDRCRQLVEEPLEAIEVQLPKAMHRLIG
jgi:hypothetical protein